jgi:multidrug efflux pump subunit AcrA (membrane-fusion protein)
MGLASVALLVAAILEIGPPARRSRTQTEIVTAAEGIVQSTVSGSGNVEPAVQDTVNFKTGGTLQAVYVHVGEHVRKGQLLAALDPSAAQLALDEAKLSLTAAQDNLNTAESDGTSAAASASAGGSASTGGSASADAGPGTGGSASAGASTGAGASATPSPATIASDQAAVDSATEQVDSAEQTLADTKLYAPISGTIVSLQSISPGDSVSAGASGSSSSSSSATSSSSSSGAGGALAALAAGALGSSSSSSSSSSSGFAEIINSSALTMTVALSESDISAIKVGQAATVTLDALTGVELGAHVSAISPMGSDSNGVVSYDVTLTLDQSSPKVKPGMSAEASIITAQASGVTLPNAAVPGTGSLSTVRVRADGHAVTRQVVVGLRGTTRTQILSGLSAGQQVVVTETLPPLGTAASSSATSATGTLGGAGVGGRFGAGGFGAGGFGAGGFFRGGGGGFGG